MFNDVKTVMKLQGSDLITGTVQDCTPYAERTKALSKEGFHGSKELKHAASFPFVLVEKYCNDAGITFEQFMKGTEHVKKMLNDPALSDFRIWKGRT